MISWNGSPGTNKEKRKKKEEIYFIKKTTTTTLPFELLSQKTTSKVFKMSIILGHNHTFYQDICRILRGRDGGREGRIVESLFMVSVVCTSCSVLY